METIQNNIKNKLTLEINCKNLHMLYKYTFNCQNARKEV